MISVPATWIVTLVKRRYFSVRDGSGTVVCERCLLADTALLRLRGLLGRKELPAGEGVLLTPAASIHTWFMHFPIDVVFLESDLTVLGMREAVRPWRFSGWRGARSVLELPAGTCELRRIRPGDRLTLSEVGDDRASVLLVLDKDGGGNVLVGRGPVSVFATTLVVLSVMDIRTRRLPNRIVLPAALAVLAAHLVIAPDRAFEWIAASLGAFAVLLAAALVYPGGLGMGDVKLALLLGAALGWAVVTALAIGFVVAAVAGALLLLLRGWSARKATLPLGPFLAFGGVAALLL
jgi:uncharacterized membrane protein (UPF0127 family)/Flp pilus assembly protein protease CpaA